MAAIQCKGCGAYLSVKGLVNCPRCQTYLEPEHHIKQAEAIALQNRNLAAISARHLLVSKLKGTIAVASVAGLIAFIVWVFAFPSKPSEERKRHDLISAARVACQYAIQSTAKFGDAELPPYVKNYARDGEDEFYFAWPSGSFLFTNGFGAKEKMSASCTGVLSTGKITQLTINGRDIL